MIIDCHTHIFPQQIQNNRENFFDNEPAFKILYNSHKSKLIGADALVEAMDANGVDKSVVFGFPWKDENVYKLNNDYIIESVEKYPDRLIGFSCFDTSHKKCFKEAKRCFDAGLSGIGELAYYEHGIDENVLESLGPIMDLCNEKNKPIMIHTNEPIGHVYPGKSPNTLLQIYNLAKKFPENKIILAHWGGGVFFFHLLKKEAKEVLSNIYFDTAATPFLYDIQIWNIAQQIIDVDKILFGSDYPLIKPTRYFKEMNQAQLTQDVIDSVCGKNAEKLILDVI